MITYTYPLTITNTNAVTVTADDITTASQLKENAEAIVAGLAPWQWPTTPLAYIQSLTSAPKTVIVTVNMPTGSTQSQADAVFQQQKYKIFNLQPGQSLSDLLTVTIGNTAVGNTQIVSTASSVATVVNPIQTVDFAVQDPTITAVGGLDSMHIRAVLAQLARSQNLLLTTLSAKAGIGKYGLTPGQLESAGVLIPGTTNAFLISSVKVISDVQYRLVLESPGIWTGKFGATDYSQFATDSAQNAILESLFQTAYTQLISSGKLIGTESAEQTASALITAIYINSPMLSQLIAGAVYAINLVDTKITNDLKNYTTVDVVTGNTVVSTTQLAVNVATTSLVSTGKTVPSNIITGNK